MTAVTTIPFRTNSEPTASVHYHQGERANIRALESVYEKNEVPAPNLVLARQRIYTGPDEAPWDLWWHGSPQVQGHVGRAKMLLFDHRVVDPSHLDDHPLLNPAYLSDNWSRLKDGAAPVPRAYFSALMDLSRQADSGVIALRHADINGVNRVSKLGTALKHPYFSAFLGIPTDEQAQYAEAHRAKWDDKMGLWCTLGDASEEEPMGRVSVFDLNNLLRGDGSLDYAARLLAVPRALASVGAEGATKEVL